MHKTVVFLAWFPIWCKKVGLCDNSGIYVYVSPLQIFHHLTDFHENSYKHYAIEVHPNLTLFNFP
jgi:hypothetical protein